MKRRTSLVLPRRLRHAFFLFSSLTILQSTAHAQVPVAGTLMNLKTVESNIDPRGVAITPDGSKAVMADWENTRVRIIQMSDLSSTFAATEARPDDVVIDASGTYAYVNNVASNSISRIKLSDGTSTPAYVSTISSTGSPRAVDITPDGNTLIVACNGGSDASAELVFINLTNATILGRVAVTNGAQKIAVHPDGTSVFTAGYSTSGTVTEVNIASRSITGSYNYGSTNGAIKAIGFNKGATIFYTAHSNGYISAYSGFRGTPAQVWSASLIPANLDNDWANSYAFDSTYGRLYMVTHNTSGAGNLLITIDLTTQTRLSDVGASTWPNSIGISKTGRFMMLSLRRYNQARYYSVPAYNAGSGTSGSPYEITTWAHLYNVRENPGAYFKLMNNLDNGTSGYANFAGSSADVSKGWSPLGDATTNFTGEFNGNGNTISDLVIARSTSDNTGMFGYLGSAALVKNLRISNVSVTGNNNTGSLAGQNSGTIQDCSVSVTVSGADNTGGLVGKNAGTINRSFSTGTVNATGAASGGLVGAQSTGAVSNAYSMVNVSGATTAGGFIGAASGGSLQNCYSTGTVTGGTPQGFAGSASATVTNCLWDTQRSGVAGSAAGTGKTTADMKTFKTFLDNSWDLSCERLNGNADTWVVSSGINSGYPALTSFSNTMTCPVWTATSSTDMSNSGNWQNGEQAYQGMDFTIGSGATSDLTLTQAWTAGNVSFNASNVKIVLGNNDLYVLGTVTGAGAGKYFKTDGTGRFRQNVLNTATITFPVGRSAYNPVAITNNTGSDDMLSIRVRDEVLINGTTGGADPGNYVVRTWDIDKAAANAGSGLNFTFNWNTGETQGTVAVPKLFHYDGTHWEKQTGSTSYTSTSLTYSGYTGTFSPFAIADNQTPLPVSWTAFTANCSNGAVQLKWSTANETNNQYFQIEKSADLRNWAVLGKIQGANNSNMSHDYSYTDEATGTSYYRIRQVDFNGKESMSTTIVSRCGSDPVVKLLMAVNLKLVTVSGLTQPAGYQLVDSRGSVLRSGTLMMGRSSIDLSSVPAGVYFLKMNSPQTQEAQKIVVY